MTRIYYIFLLLIFVSSCNYSAPSTPAADATGDTGTTSGDLPIEKLPTGSIPSYQSVATEIIAPKCLGCHSSGGGNAAGINLESYTNVKKNLEAISSAVTSGSMPKNIAPLTADQKEFFLSWIDAGGPLNSPTVATGPTTTPTNPAPVPVPTPSPVPTPTTPPGGVVVDPNKIDYKMVNSQVLSLRCVSCHSDSGGNAAGINLETYQNVFNERNSIKSVINSGSMPRPTNNPLTAKQKTTILTWLSKGAPELVP